MNDAITPAEILKVDGKTLSFRRFGNGKRKILFFHGFPGSSAQSIPFRAFAESFDFEVISVDRPGYNQSELTHRGQFEQATMATWGLLKIFGWTSCEVISVSGGTPFLFSFVQAFPDFVSRISIISGLAPLVTNDFQDLIGYKTIIILRLLPNIPGAMMKRILPKSEANQAPQRAGLIQKLLPSSAADRIALQKPFIQNMLGQSLREAFLQDGIGPRRDAKVYLTPWSLKVSNFKGPIDIWHGSEDLVLPPPIAKRMAKSLMDSRLHIIEGEGHYSLAIDYIEEILRGG